MRQFIKNKDICFHEEDFNKLIYGRSQKYKSLDLDFDTNVLPYLLSEKLKRTISWITNYENDQQRNWELAKYLTEILSEMVIFNKGPSGISVNDDFIDIMEISDDLCFFASDIKSTETSNESKSLLELANETMYTQEHIDVMDFLYRVDGNILIRANYPQSLYDLIYDALTCLFVICMKHPEQAASHIKVTPNEIINTEEEAYKIKEYVRFDNGVLVFEDIEFKTLKDANLIRDLFLHNPEDCIRAVCFVRCHFNSPEISFSVNPLRMYFKECIFEKQVSFRNTDNRIEFDTCLFYGNIKTFGLEDLWIHHSTFELGSSLLIKDRITPMNISDENKHQYISCVGSQGGLGSSAITLVGGALKEGKDISKKLSNSEERKKYGGSLGVLKDSAKDMKNNLYGAGYGLTYRQNGDCNSLLKRKIK